jgi:hypothetical protein
VRRRHPDIEDRDVRTLSFHEPHQLGHVPCLANDLEAGCCQCRSQRLPKEDGVVGQDDATHLCHEPIVPPGCNWRTPC